jgi:glycosyltransferase involved in cell wall biosynthesis
MGAFGCNCTRGLHESGYALNILLLTASLPFPATSGGALRAYSLIRAMTRLGHRVHLLAFDEGGARWQDTPLAGLCASVRTVVPPQRTMRDRITTLLLSRQADVARRLYSVAMAGALREVLARERFDLIQAEGIEMAWLLPLTKQSQPTAKMSFDTFNAEYQLQRVIALIDAQEPLRWPVAFYSWLQSRRIARFERDMGRLADLVIAVSPEDAAALGKLLPDKKIHVIPSAIAVEEYAITETRNLGSHAIVFTGKMDYRPNVDAALWFADEIFPRIRRRVPDAVFHIVGQQPHERLDRLRGISGIEVSGFVRSVVPYLRGGAVYVAPLRMGSGTRLKLLEAMAAGSAIVATPIAAAGLLPDAKAAMRLAANAESFAETVSSLLGDPTTRRSLGQTALAAVSSYYDWTSIADSLRQVYEEAGIGG